MESSTTKSGSLSSHPVTIDVSPREISEGTLSWPHLEVAVGALHRDGLVVLENVVSDRNLDILNMKMVEDARVLQAKGEDGPYNYNKGVLIREPSREEIREFSLEYVLKTRGGGLARNIQQDPPATKEYFDPWIFLNPIATQVTSAILGPRPRLSFLSGNTALPPSSSGNDSSPPQSQPTHSDADFAHPDFPFALVVNVPLVQMRPENGSTEVWLGTHLGSNLDCQEGQHGDRASGRIRADLLEERRRARPPSQPTVKKGSIIIRDLRLWHGGKPNLTDQVRVMLAMIHFAPWYRNPMRIELAEELKPMLEDQASNLQIQANYLPAAEVEQRYLNRPHGNAYDFGQEDATAQALA